MSYDGTGHVARCKARKIDVSIRFHNRLQVVSQRVWLVFGIELWNVNLRKLILLDCR